MISKKSIFILLSIGMFPFSSKIFSMKKYLMERHNNNNQRQNNQRQNNQRQIDHEESVEKLREIIQNTTFPSKTPVNTSNSNSFARILCGPDPRHIKSNGNDHSQGILTWIAQINKETWENWQTNK